MSRNRIRIAGVLAGLAALTASLFPMAALAEVPAEQVPADLHAAIKAEIESKGHTYAGLCRVVNEGNPVPFEYCAFVNSIEHDIAEVTYGPVLSDELTQVNFVHQNGKWVKQGTTPAPTTPTTPSNPSVPKPPSTGNGTIDESGDGMNVLVLGAAAAAAVAGVGAVGLATARKR